ncbi:MAG: hypothetical protein F4221_00645 [Rhodothermaceae bacterium]|nr:hypothetical protein [Rhodothermaceae bacterium]
MAGTTNGRLSRNSNHGTRQEILQAPSPEKRPAALMVLGDWIGHLGSGVTAEAEGVDGIRAASMQSMSA